MIRRALGAEVEHFDDGTAAGMVDAILRYPDGREGSIEMTTIADQAALEVEAHPSSLRIEAVGWWTMRFDDPRTSRKDMERFGPALVRRLEALELDDAQACAEDDLRHTIEGRWFLEHAVSLRRYRQDGRGGRLDILPALSAGFVDHSLRGLAAWVEGLQVTRIWRQHVDKLVRSGRDELHLALRVHSSGMPFAVWSALWDPQEVRSRMPRNMAPITHLWIFSGVGESAIRWDKDTGWRVLSLSS